MLDAQPERSDAEDDPKKFGCQSRRQRKIVLDAQPERIDNEWHPRNERSPLWQGENGLKLRLFLKILDKSLGPCLVHV